MTRKKLWTLNAIGLGAFALALTAINPGLAAAPIGFCILYLPLLAALLAAQWLISTRHVALRLVWGATAAALAFSVMGVAGGPTAGMVAMVLWLITVTMVPAEHALDETVKTR